MPTIKTKYELTNKVNPAKTTKSQDKLVQQLINRNAYNIGISVNGFLVGHFKDKVEFFNKAGNLEITVYKSRKPQ